MSQVLNQETPQTDEFYKQEIHKMLAEMSRHNDKMNRDQEEISRLEMKSKNNLQRIEIKLQEIERILN
jgi:hypothetical protein